PSRARSAGPPSTSSPRRRPETYGSPATPASSARRTWVPRRGRPRLGSEWRSRRSCWSVCSGQWGCPSPEHAIEFAMSTTPSLAGSFQLASGEVHSWCASLDVLPAASARLYATLSLEERPRRARFRFERCRQRFIASSGVLRELLGGYLQTLPR